MPTIDEQRAEYARQEARRQRGADARRRRLARERADRDPNMSQRGRTWDRGNTGVDLMFENAEEQIEVLAPSGVPVADVPSVETDVTAIDQAAVEEAMVDNVPPTRTGFLLPFIIGFGAAWVARELKVF